MLTRPGREAWVRRALASLEAQRDVAVSLFLAGCTPDHGESYAEEYAGRLDATYAAAAAGPAAFLRAVVSSRRADEFVALWDDDDLYHPLRLRRQLDQIVLGTEPPTPLCFLSAAMYYFPDTAELFVADLERRHHPLPTRVIPSTLLCRVDAVDAGAHPAAAVLPHADVASPTDRFARAVLGRRDAVRPEGEWWWMVKAVPQDNPDYDRHRRTVTDVARGKPAAWLSARRALVCHWLDQYPWDGDLDVCGPDGVAFRYSPAARWPDDLPPPRTVPENPEHA